MAAAVRATLLIVDLRAVAPRVRSSTERALLWLEGLLAVAAFGGGISFIVGAADLGEATADLPFGSIVFAGWALVLINGVLPTVVLIGALRWRRWATRWGHLVVGSALLGWVVVQVAVLGPPLHWLQAVYAAYGAGILMLATRLTRTAP